MNKKNKNILKGMEHLKAELEENQQKVIQESNISNNHKIIKTELIQIMFIMLLLFSCIVVIIYFDNKTDFLQTLAEKIDNRL